MAHRYNASCERVVYRYDDFWEHDAMLVMIMWYYIARVIVVNVRVVHRCNGNVSERAVHRWCDGNDSERVLYRCGGCRERVVHRCVVVALVSV